MRAIVRDYVPSAGPFRISGSRIVGSKVQAIGPQK